MTEEELEAYDRTEMAIRDELSALQTAKMEVLEMIKKGMSVEEIEKEIKKTKNDFNNGNGQSE